MSEFRISVLPKTQFAELIFYSAFGRTNYYLLAIMTSCEIWKKIEIFKLSKFVCSPPNEIYNRCRQSFMPFPLDVVSRTNVCDQTFFSSGPVFQKINVTRTTNKSEIDLIPWPNFYVP